MDKAELRKLFMNMYSGNTNAWGAISKRFKREDIQGKKKLKREAESFPSFSKLIQSNIKAVQSNQNKQDWNISKPQSIRINQQTFGQMQRDAGGNRKANDVAQVDSSAVESIQAKPRGDGSDKKDVVVQFVGGGHPYMYPSVDKRVVQSFLMSPSKGAFVNKVLSRYSDVSDPHVQKFIREGN